MILPLRLSLRFALGCLLLGCLFRVMFCSLAPLVQAADEAPTKPAEAKISAASDEGQRAIAGFKIPPGFKMELVAAEPMLANPAAFCLDERGRIYVAETFRQGRGVEDNRGHANWLDDDLAAQTVEDRLAYYKKHLKEKVIEYATQDDRLRLLEDRDGDGKMDRATVFAQGFNGVLDGTGAGVLARGGDVFYACIPHLWLLRDDNNDGVAETRKSLHYGYGVRVAFRGHDLHGLVFGPDGKLYYSIGDRGYNVESEGRRLAQPDRGAVFRCNPDGTELEVVASGFRNPQELAFDEFGNLFTGDNNSDSGDKARWVYIVEGADIGWRMNYQYLSDRGPWNREKLWHPQWEGQAAYITPPIANLADGPSGLTYYPGVGMPEKYRGHFFLCDFRGSKANSGVRSFAVQPKGAGFELVDSEQFAWSILCTDATFGPDSALYISDWVEGWNGPGKGRIYRLYDAEKRKSPLVDQTKQIIGEGMARRPLAELAHLLAHADMRVRQAAQFELAGRGMTAVDTLKTVAAGGAQQLARLHAIWGLGQIGRKQPEALSAVGSLLADPDAEVRSQAAKVLGDARIATAQDGLTKLLADDSPRVRMFAAIALGKLARKETVGPALAMLRDNADADPFLRHAGVMALVGSGGRESLIAAAKDESPAARLAAVVALRRLESPEVARFLNDVDPRVVEEAARAINDAPLDAAMPQLAALSARRGLTEPTVWRVINANFRLGEAQHAAAVAGLAGRADVPETARLEAMNSLLDWAKPNGRDRVLGSWRPLANRAENLAADALRPALPGILTSSDRIRKLGVQLAGKLGIREVSPALLELAGDRSRPAEVRVEALRALEALKDQRVPDAMQIALADNDPVLRAAGQRLLAQRKPDEALTVFGQVLADGSLIERQGALAALAAMKEPAAEELLAQWVDKLVAGQAPAELLLDIVEAAAKSPASGLKQKLAKYEATRPHDGSAAYRESLAGGDSGRGRKLFFERADVYCVRCHKVAGEGGEVGPDLSKVGREKARDYLLEAIVEPNKAIAKGFESVTLVMNDGKVLAGVLRGEDDKQLKLVTAEGKLLTIDKEHIDERASGKSAMPEDLVKKLTKSDVRDLVEFLSVQKAK